MSESKDSEINRGASDPLVPQVLYSYPAPTNNDEIDLGDLLSRLAAQYKLIVGITVIGMLITLAIAMCLPKIYRQEIIVSKPYETDIIELNANGYKKFTAQSIFKRYYDELRSQERLETFIIEGNFLPALYPKSSEQENTLIAKLNKDFKVEILEPQPSVKGGSVSEPARILVRLEHENEEAIAKLLNDYILYIEKSLVKDLSKQQKLQIESELKSIERDIALLRISGRADRETEIEKLDEKNRIEIEELNTKIEALLLKSETDSTHELIAMDSAYKVAKKLNIKKPTSIVDIGRNFSESSNKTEITLTDRQELPLYLMGTDYLDAKREELKTRKDNTPFIAEYSSLKQKIKILQDDAYLKALKNRGSDDPYIDGLSKLMERKERLKKLSINFDEIKTLKIEKRPKVTGINIKPKKVLILVGGSVLSFLLALFIGVVSAALISNRRVE
jgi:LPS O-antigen subunit length determinant protein (WzzB/FepE family)